MHLLGDKVRRKLLVIILLLVLTSLVVFIYNKDNTVIIENSIKIPTTNATIIENTNYKLDESNTDKGILNVTYTGNKKDALVRIRKIRDALGRDLKTTEDYDYIIKPNIEETLTFTCGNGEYKVVFYENLEGNRYIKLTEREFKSTNLDIQTIFTASTFYTSYKNSGEDFDKLLKLFQNTCKTNEEYIKTAYNWVSKNIDYDNKLANKINRSEISVYQPDIKRIIKEKSGICLDSSCLYAALLRANNIPARIVFGYADDVYHAWVEVYMDGKWHLYDTTFSNDTNNTKKIRYTIKYIY